MGRIIYWVYNIVVLPLLYLAFHILQFSNKKIKDGIAGRKNQFEKIAKEMKNIPTSRKRICFHCTSVGEWEQAVPLIESIRKDSPDIFIAVSFFSPSGFNYAKRYDKVDLKCYLPFDTYNAAKKYFSLIKPSLWVISKFDIWPNHLVVAEKMGIKTILTAATLSSNSRRDKGIMAPFNKFIYSKFDYIYPISDNDKQRFLKLFPFPEKIEVTGDTRFDQVYNKGQRVLSMDKVPLFKNDKPITIIAGSIWPADEEHVLQPLVNVVKKYDQVNMILVPHELHEAHLHAIEKAYQSENIPVKRYTEMECKDEGIDERVIIINTIGLLARLYKQTDIAYVGGSFSTGVHNVMEPAVFGQPVIFGPIYMNSFEAEELVKAGSAFSGSTAPQLESLLIKFIENEDARKQCGEISMNLIKENIGASDKIIKSMKERYECIS